ncbi:MAG: class I SAM-dependent methyltransferase [Candidatus Binatia bacterium]
MMMFFTSLVLAGFLVSAIHAPAVMAKVLSVEEIRATLSASHRSAKNRARDRYRHPAETLVFFGLADDMTVVEVAPGRGWYTDAIAPLLLKRGKLYAAGNALDVPGQRKYRYPRQRDYNKKIADNPQVYGAVEISHLTPPQYTRIAPPGTADLVVTFRNVHNWLKRDPKPYFKAMYDALKPGGFLGVVEHRAKPGTSLEKMIKSGYMTEAKVIELAEEAGFKLFEKSEINANPKDTADHPRGVWTLPPSLRLKDQDRDKYLAIGESDRMTLKFQKPVVP